MVPKVLVIEDEDSLSQLIHMSLAKLKYDVVTARTGDDAEKTLLEGIKPDLILLDLLIPGKNGFEVLKFLKANNSFKSIPVVVLTNYTEETAKSKAMALGATAYVLKTDISFSEIPEIVHKYLP